MSISSVQYQKVLRVINQKSLGIRVILKVFLSKKSIALFVFLWPLINDIIQIYGTNNMGRRFRTGYALLQVEMQKNA